MNRTKGQMFLALMFLIGGAVVAIGLTLAFITSSFVDTGYGYRAAVQAEAVATSGAEDALLQLNRNSSFSNESGYNVPVGSSTAVVAVAQGVPDIGFASILSTATISNRTKNIEVVVAVNATTSQVTIVSWQEL
jgi:hypothetical protein